MSKRRICVVSAALVREGRYLITQRLEKAVLPLLWEFPGGKVEEGESDEVALKRELKERLGIDAVVKKRIASTEREYRDYVVEMHLYSCDLGPVEPRKVNVRDLKWVNSKEFGRYEFTPADQGSMDALLFGDKKTAKR
ncbi:MAG: (deoxy)nucleoside triphosphate pyrophosphohydrolase [Deltaproteobacteria bacterium]|nr:(deoxy)nucleoside triphosphate pyrophosphohydrolase [Deltaproteobacteria bacterium]